MMSVHTLMMLNGLFDFLDGSFRIVKGFSFVFALMVPCEPNIRLIFRKLIFTFVMDVSPFD